VPAKRNRYVVLILFILLALTGAAFAQDADDPETRYTSLRVHVRACPQLSCDVVETAATGTELIVLGRETGENVSNSDQWLRVELVASGAQGYINLKNTLRFPPEIWKERPVIPEVTETALEIYRRGLELGNHPDRFSKVGDCQNVTSYFLTAFDYPLQHDLGEHDYLQAAIDHFAGSFEREGAAVRDGFNVASVLSPMWANPDLCEKGENSLQCEYRLYRPGFVVISMETWWSGRPADEYEDYLARIVEFWIDNGVVPILATKADNLEVDHSLNASIAHVAETYDVPLWNFWAALEGLPNRGLEDDDFHLTYNRNFFNDPAVMQAGWPVRNLTALQALDTVWRGVTGES
jgi:hypothetical protein